MNRRVRACVGGLTVACALLAMSAPAGAHTRSGPERFSGFLVARTTNGQRHVLATMVEAHGVFNGRGRIVEVDSQPSDPENVLHDDLVFTAGTMHLVSVNLDFSFEVDPVTCRATFEAHQTATIEGGTGDGFVHAAGQLTGGRQGSRARPASARWVM